MPCDIYTQDKRADCHTALRGFRQFGIFIAQAFCCSKEDALKAVCILQMR